MRGRLLRVRPGSVPFAALAAELEHQGCNGWGVVEQDVLPGMGTPLEIGPSQPRLPALAADCSTHPHQGSASDAVIAPETGAVTGKKTQFFPLPVLCWGK